MNVFEGKIKWVDIFNPTRADLDYIKTLHSAIHPVILDELLHYSTRAKVEHYGSYLFLTYHFPVYDPVARTSRREEIDFIILPNAIITVHYNTLEAIQKFAAHLGSRPDLKPQLLSNTGYVLYYLIQELHHLSLRQLKHVEDHVTSVTHDLFKHKEYALLRRISYIKRDLLDYGVVAKPQALLLHSLKDVGAQFWGKELEPYLADLCGDHLKITELLENMRATIESCEATNGQLLNAKTNMVMQRFTILAFLTFPLMLYTSIFSVNAVSTLFSDAWDFWIGFGAMLFITIGAIYFFQRKGLLRD